MNKPMHWTFVATLILCMGCKTVDRSGEIGGLSALDIFQSDAKPLICTPKQNDELEKVYASYLPGEGEKMEDGSIVTPDKYRPYIKEQLSVVPLAVIDWFFTKGGHLNLVRDVEETCAAHEKSLAVKDYYVIPNATGNVGGCISGDGQSLPRIMIGVRDELISLEQYDGDFEQQLREDLSNISQGFALIEAMYLTDINVSESGDAVFFEYGKGDQDMQLIKTSLAFMVADDLIKLKESEGIDIPEIYSNLLTGELAKLLDGSIERNKRWESVAWPARNQANFKQFANYMFAQWRDSERCNEETKNLLYGTSAMFKGTASWYQAGPKAAIDEALNARPDLATNRSDRAEVNGAASMALNADNAPSLDGDNGLQLAGQGYRFPILAKVLSAPVAVARFFRDNQPVRTFFKEKRPVRRAMFRVGQGIRQAARAVFPGNRCWRIRRSLCR